MNTMQYGSLTNSLIARGTVGMPAPEVGMGATELCWSDRHACTIVEVIDAKTIVVQRDVAKLVNADGIYGIQAYEYTANPDASRILVTLRKDGQWHEGKQCRNTKGRAFSVGARDEYFCPSF